MFDRNTLIEDHLRRIRQLRELGIDPYPAAAYHPTHSAAEVQNAPETLMVSSEPVKVAGRIFARRDMGKATFLDLLDESYKVQVYFRQPALEPLIWNALHLLDIGDIIGVKGRVFRTRTGEVTINVADMTVLCKATHPIPLPKRSADLTYHAITDKGTLYRQRHVDLLSNAASREIFLKRTQIIRGIRRYLDGEGFIEVETPILGHAYSGAAARPFGTKLHALNQDMFLRISPECALKRLLCGGFNRVYEIGKNFRNEGIDASHNPEFTMLEFYESGSDYLHQMIRFETLVASLSEEINGSTHIRFRGRTLDLTPPWRRLPILDGLREVAGLDLARASAEEMPDIFRLHHPHGAKALPDPLTWGIAVAELFEALVEPHLWEPVLVMDHPIEISPLTKRHRSDPRLVERFEPMIGGMEVGNSYSELNDPVEQYERLVSQRVSRAKTYDLDQEFLQAIAHGMPQAGGTGLGVNRIVMILTGAESIRDVVFFPFTSCPELQQVNEPTDESALNERSAMNSPERSSHVDRTSSSPSPPPPPTNLEPVRSFVTSLKLWIADSLSVIEEGISRARADPIELVMDFQPWLQEALEKIGPNLTALSSGESQELIAVLGRVIDAIERAYAGSGQSPLIGLGQLDGLDDLLVGLAFRSRAGACAS